MKEKLSDSEIRFLFNRMFGLIRSSNPEHKEIVERYLSLANFQLNKEFDKTGDWKFIGASEALKNKFIEKFGCFIAREKGIIL